MRRRRERPFFQCGIMIHGKSISDSRIHFSFHAYFPNYSLIRENGRMSLGGFSPGALRRALRATGQVVHPPSPHDAFGCVDLTFQHSQECWNVIMPPLLDSNFHNKLFPVARAHRWFQIRWGKVPFRARGAQCSHIATRDPPLTACSCNRTRDAKGGVDCAGQGVRSAGNSGSGGGAIRRVFSIIEVQRG